MSRNMGEETACSNKIEKPEKKISRRASLEMSFKGGQGSTLGYHTIADELPV
jgi:hypothetical protein